MTYFQTIDAITVLWNELEALVNVLPFKDETVRLSTERYGPSVRLCYQGRPLCESSAVERIEAVYHLDLFLEKWLGAGEERTKRAEEARVILQDKIQAFRSLDSA